MGNPYPGRKTWAPWSEDLHGEDSEDECIECAFADEVFPDDVLFDPCGESERDNLKSFEAYLDELEAEATEAEERELDEPLTRKKRFRRTLEGKAQRAFDRQERFRSRGAGGGLIRRGGRKGGDRYITYWSRWSWNDCWDRQPFGPNWGRWPRRKLRAPDAALRYQKRHGELFVDYDGEPGDDAAVIYFEPIHDYWETSDLDPEIIDRWVERRESPTARCFSKAASEKGWRTGRQGRIRFARSFDPSDLRSKKPR